MKYIDLHADTVLSLLQEGNTSSLYDNINTHIDIKRLQKGRALAQCFAVWLPSKINYSTDVDIHVNPANQAEDIQYIDLAVKRLKQEIEQNSHLIAWAENAAEIRANDLAGKISAILTLEDARAVDNSLENIECFFQQGFQMIGLMWNNENCFGYPNSANPSKNSKGLKPFGIEGIQYIEELGMIVDVSHLNDAGIADVLKYSNNPVVASHSNARAITNHSRNLPDEYIKGIAESGGVVGVCISPRFLRGEGEMDSTINDIVLHLNRIYNIGGEDVLAIGTDFDGTSGNIELNSPEKIPQLFEQLISLGWPLKRIEKLAQGNALRVFEK